MHSGSVAKLWFVTAHPWESGGQLKGDILLSWRWGKPPCCFRWLSLFVVVCSCWLSRGCNCAFTSTCWAVVCGLQIHLHWCFHIPSVGPRHTEHINTSHFHLFKHRLLSIWGKETLISFRSFGCYRGRGNRWWPISWSVLTRRIVCILKLVIYLSD